MDILVILLFAFAIAVVMGFGIVNVIDKKISNVAVNIPPIEIPRHTVVVQLSERDSKNIDNIKNITCDAKVERIKETKKVKQEDTESEISTETSTDVDVDIDVDIDAEVNVEVEDKTINKIRKKVEHFASEELNKKLNKELDQGQSVLQKEIFNFIDNPNRTNEVNYDVILKDDKNYRPPKAVIPKPTPFKSGQYLKCENASIGEKVQKGQKYQIPNQLQCGQDDNVSPEDYYKKKYRPPIARIGPYKMKGANYADYNNYVSPYDLNLSIVPRNNLKESANKIPRGINYVFNDSPANKRDL